MAGVNATEWGLDEHPRARGVVDVRRTGDGIVVANIDTGVQFDHPALVSSVPRQQATARFDHNYNWFDPSRICGIPSLRPCDNNGHGTHTMGTMVGDDGDPGATRSASRRTRSGSRPRAARLAAASLESLLAAGQWMLAPTDLNGQNPRPDLRPNIVNNSWGGGGGDPFFQQTVQCLGRGRHLPGVLRRQLAARAAARPARRATTRRATRPARTTSTTRSRTSRAAARRRSAVRSSRTSPRRASTSVSSVPGDGYGIYQRHLDGAPHLAGTVALMWSAAPALIGDIATTRALLESDGRRHRGRLAAAACRGQQRIRRRPPGCVRRGGSGRRAVQPAC